MVYFGPHTVKLILRPSVTSSGRTFRNSRMQAWLSASLPKPDTTVWTTSFHPVICIARMAKQTHSWVRMGRGPAAKTFRSPRTWSRSSGNALVGICWMSYVIFARQYQTLHAREFVAVTLPLNVVAANIWCSASTRDCKIPIVICQASVCHSCQLGWSHRRGTVTTYRLLELLQVQVRRLFLFSLSIAHS
jgi:hypothetical protein